MYCLMDQAQAPFQHRRDLEGDIPVFRFKFKGMNRNRALCPDIHDKVEAALEGVKGVTVEQ